MEKSSREKQMDTVIAEEAVSGDLNKGIASLDGNRAKQAEQLCRVERASENLLIRERLRLKQKYGSNHPRVDAISQRILAKQLFRQELCFISDQAHVEPIETNEKKYALHGFVRDEHYRSVPYMTVAFYHDKGDWVSELGHHITNDKGYYVVESQELSDEESAKIQELIRSQKLELRVMDQQQNIAFSHKEIVMPMAGKADYRAILVHSKYGPRKAPQTSVMKEKQQQPPVSKKWIVRGSVKDEDGQALSGLLVRLYDLDRKYDDKLGGALTDKEGKFLMEYHVRDFKEGKEVGADLYLIVTNKEEEVLYSSKDAVRFDATANESYDIVVGDKKSKPCPSEEHPPKVEAVPVPVKVIKEKEEDVVRSDESKETQASIALEEINGLGPSRAKKLRKAGINDVSAFVAADDEKLISILGNVDIQAMKKDGRKLLKAK
ncbi:MAG: helix-hairpin-helix domain-containing protein [Verrucomicrobiota bacterium]